MLKIDPKGVQLKRWLPGMLRFVSPQVGCSHHDIDSRSSHSNSSSVLCQGADILGASHEIGTRTDACDT